MLNKILTAINGRLKVTNLFGGVVADKDTLDGMPLGTADGTATGEIGVKVIIIAGGSGGGGGGTVGAATAAKQDVGNASVASIDTKTGTNITSPTAMPAGGAGLLGWLSAIYTKLNASLAVTGTFWQATQPVSGAFFQATQPISAAALPLPVGAATEATLAALNGKAIDGASATMVNSTAYEASRVLKASAGKLFSVSGYNSGPNQFIQLFNSATVPANGAAPVKVIAVPTGANFSIDVPISALPFSTGISISNSTTGPTKTLGAADCYFTAIIL